MNKSALYHITKGTWMWRWSTKETSSYLQIYNQKCSVHCNQSSYKRSLKHCKYSEWPCYAAIMAHRHDDRLLLCCWSPLPAPFHVCLHTLWNKDQKGQQNRCGDTEVKQVCLNNAAQIKVTFSLPSTIQIALCYSDLRSTFSLIGSS